MRLKMAGWHGFLGDPGWPPPACIVKSGLVARPGHDSCDASEYLDSAAVLEVDDAQRRRQRREQTQRRRQWGVEEKNSKTKE